MSQQQLIKKAIINVKSILDLSIHSYESKRIAIIYDLDHPLANILYHAYRANLINAEFIEFNDSNKNDLITLFDSLEKGDLVIMIQSSNFRINEFRIRLHLFEKGVKVVEHMHLYRNSTDQYDTYINSLNYDKKWYQRASESLNSTLVNLDSLVIQYKDDKLEINGKLELPKPNIGDYTNMKNIGGAYPIGEIFTEVEDFKNLNGTVWIYGYANKNFDVIFVEPFWVKIIESLIVEVSPEAPIEFCEIIKHVSEYETPLIREIGFGLNKAITRDKPLGDITAYERTIGFHLSLGHKHSVYKKEGIKAHKARFHIDLFIQTDIIFTDKTVIFENNKYVFDI